MQKTGPISRIKQFFFTPKGRIIGLWWTYFLYWGSIAPFVPFVGLYYESVGLTGTQIGQIGSLRAIVSFFSAIALAFVSDVIRKRKRVLFLCVIGIIVSMLIFPQMMSLVSLMFIISLYSIFQAPSIAIIDEDTLRALENPRDFSQVRIGGSAGWGIMVFLAGLMMDKPGVPLNIMFTLHILILVPLLVLIYFLPESVPTPDESGKKASLADVLDLLRYPGFALWMGIIFLFGAAESSLINFLFLHIRDLGGSSSLMGLTMTFAIVGEVVGFSFAKRMQHNVGSRRMIVIAIAVRTLWYFLVAVIRSPLLILPAQILGGMSFAIIESGSVAYVNERAPRRIGTTAQGVRSAVLLRLSTVVGSLIAGALYENYGSVTMYIVMGFTSLVSLALAARLRIVERQRESKTMSA